VFDVDAVRRVPGGIASHRETVAVIGPKRPPPAGERPR
jgi:hypothetical protein